MTAVPPAVQFSLRQVFLQWSLGMYVSIPVIAILQGSYHLSEYRTHHANAPRPAMPVRGVTVAVERGFRAKFLSRKEPLRLLVVGDSLAAGVGMSKSGIPVLPESIARAISKACDGRPVEWTCIGTPGVSASQIVQDIHGIQPPQPGRIDSLFREWTLKRRKWQERREIRRRLTDLEHHHHHDDDDKVDIHNDDNNYLKEWWDTIRKDPERSVRKFQETTDRFVRAWWTQFTRRANHTRDRVKESLTDIQEIVRTPVLDVPDDKVLSLADDEKKEKEDDDGLIHPGTPFTRDFVDPKVAAQYDIAVVLFGLNDLKDAFLPHMTRGPMSSLKDGTENITGGLRNQLYRIIDALDQKMDKTKTTTTTTNDDHSSKDQKCDADGQPQRQQKQENNPRRPLVVVPELPIAPLRLFNLVPLCWFLIPLFRAMENNKRFISMSFPDYVIFVPQPDMEWWTDDDSGLGSIRDNIRQERLLLRTTDVTQKVKDRIQQLMKAHYEPNRPDEDEDDSDSDSANDDENTQHNLTAVDDTTTRGRVNHSVRSDHDSDHHQVSPIHCQQQPQHYEDNDNYYYHHHDDSHNHQQYSSSSTVAGRSTSPYVAVDKMHPNDEGYELWGRHIAAAILEHWKKDP